MSKIFNLHYYLFIFALIFTIDLSAQNDQASKKNITEKLKKDVTLLEKNPDSTLASLRKLRNQVITSDPTEAIEKTFAIVHVLARTKGDYNQVLQESKIGMEIAIKINEFSALSYFHQYRSTAYFEQGFIDLGYRELEKAIHYTEKIADNNYRHIAFAQIYKAMSDYYLYKKDTLKQMLYINKSIATLKKSNDTPQITYTKEFTEAQQYEILATIFNSKKQPDSAEFYYLLAYKLHNRNNFALYDKTAIIVSLSNFYFQQKDFRKAIQYALTGLSIRKENNQPYIKKEFYNI